MTAINKMVERLEKSLCKITEVSCADEMNRIKGHLDFARRLAFEEAKEKPTAPAELVEELEKVCKVEPQIIKEGREYETELICKGRLQIKDRVKEILSRHATPSGEEGLMSCPRHDQGEICAVPESKGGHDVMMNCPKIPCAVHRGITPIHPTPTKTTEPLAVRVMREFVDDWEGEPCTFDPKEQGCKHCLAVEARQYLEGLDDVKGDK